ncbi:hypothetical protein [Demequina zhanjiangensis]|uniref:HTH cro/C1-type domain-containing protein n=1 Tax=Demequina zhanjiangensis TaxID=3051659 RepID=A0ABT8G366_9MICO|nr:hypothetical protein [Demequina sp. SYSU T00b26]MDN4473570.1 hypothetical protein [Demequina sp. SYSU T00b26]
MALPKRTQRLARFLAYDGITHKQLAVALSDPDLGIEVTENEVKTLVRGCRYPTPRELERISAIFNGLPPDVFFEKSMLVYKDATSWPPHGRGFRTGRNA